MQTAVIAITVVKRTGSVDSYWGVISKHGTTENIKDFQWDLSNFI
ncbi:MAG: hypothetical protein Q8P62_00055 [Candidatus Peregrinibacteria bacterium]|nr:hypothetical protein [Candidatus Peregrinibacteria bacterium]